MKKIFLLLTLIVPMAALSQSDSSCVDNRTVISHTVTLWLKNYKEIQKTSLLGSDTTYNKLGLTLNEYNSLSFRSEAPCQTIAFKYYMTPDTVLHSAIELIDEAYYIYTEEKGWHISEAIDLKELFDFWKNYASNTDNPFVFVEKYYFNESDIKALVDKYDSITIENVIHFVSPDSQRYELKTEYKGQEKFEGLLAFDILVRVDDSSGTPVEHYNFAVPCPKNCRNSSY